MHLKIIPKLVELLRSTCRAYLLARCGTEQSCLTLVFREQGALVFGSSLSSGFTELLIELIA